MSRSKTFVLLGAAMGIGWATGASKLTTITNGAGHVAAGVYSTAEGFVVSSHLWHLLFPEKHDVPPQVVVVATSRPDVTPSKASGQPASRPDAGQSTARYESPVVPDAPRTAAGQVGLSSPSAPSPGSDMLRDIDVRPQMHPSTLRAPQGVGIEGLNGVRVTPNNR